MAMHIFWGSGAPTPDIYVLPSGSVISLTAQPFVARIKESVELPSGSVVNLQSTAPVIKTKENFNIASNGVIGLVAQGSATWKVKESCSLPTASVVVFANNAPIIRINENSQLQSGTVNVLANVPKFSINNVSVLPASVVAQVEAFAPSNTLEFRQFIFATGNLNLKARRPHFLLRPASEVGSTAGFIDLLSLTIGGLAAIEGFNSVFVTGELEVQGFAPSLRKTESSLLPQGNLNLIAGAVQFIGSEDCALPTASVVVSSSAFQVKLTESSLFGAGVLNLQAQQPQIKVKESAILAAGQVSLIGQQLHFSQSESAALPAGCEIQIEAFAESFALTQGNNHLSILATSNISLVGQALLATSSSLQIVNEEFSGGVAQYDAILWPQEWAKPFLSVCVLPSGSITLWGYKPKISVTEHQFAHLPTLLSHVRAFPIEFSLSGNLDSQLPSANISTKALPPAIIIDKRLACEDELLCLLYLL